MILSLALTIFALVAAYAVFFVVRRSWSYLRELFIFLPFITLGLVDHRSILSQISANSPPTLTTFHQQSVSRT